MLAYSEYGTNRGSSLLIAHGLYGSQRNWMTIAKHLSDTRHVITVDMRNHGQSFWSKNHEYSHMAQDLANVINHFGTPMDVLGHSMGGKAAMLLALNHPNTLRRLVIGDIAPVSYNHTQLQIIKAMKAVDLSCVVRKSDANTQLEKLGVDANLCSFLTQSLDIKTKKWRLNLDSIEQNMPAIMSFPEIDTVHLGPTLFLTGDLSNYVLTKNRSIIQSLFTKAKFAKIKQAGHWLHAEKPREFADTVRTYLDTAVF